jgi:tetratricopeptide (TPR) repeat protein
MFVVNSPRISPLFGALLILLSSGFSSFTVFAAETLPPARKAEIVRLIDSGWTESARDQLIPLVKEFPKDADLRFHLAHTSILLGDFDTADEMSRQCIDLEEDNLEFQLMRGNILGSFAQAGSKIKGIGRAKSCRKSYEKAVKLDPSNTEARESLMIFHLMAPGIVGGKQNEARVQAAAISELDPLRGYLVQAQILRHIDNDDVGARKQYLAAIDRFADQSEPCYAFARYLVQQEEFDEAIRYQKTGTDRDDDPEEALLVLARMLGNQEYWDQAIEIYEGILAEDPANSFVKTRLSKVYYQQKKFGRAHDILTQIQTEDPDFPLAYFQEGVFLCQRNQDLERAESDFLRYLNSPLNQKWASRTIAQWYLAKVYEKQGRFTKAWEMAQTASDSAPYSSFFKDEAKKMKFLGDDD